MNNELKKIVAEAIKDIKEGEFKCKYCNQAFAKESTLIVHLCEPKRRMQQKNEKGVIIGYNAWRKFFEMSQGSAVNKTYEDFCSSTFYKDFVKFGRHCVSINALNTDQFAEYVLKKQIKIANWTKDDVYNNYLFGLLRTENCKDALERSIITMQSWAEEVENEFQNYFREVATTRLVQHILNGRISPWSIYCCDSGIEALEKLDEQQLQMIFLWIDPEYWQRKLENYPADSEMNRHILSQAGL